MTVPAVQRHLAVDEVVRSIFLKGAFQQQDGYSPERWWNELRAIDFPLSENHTLRESYLKELPTRATLIDIGSFLGENSSLPYANQHPDRDVVMIDRFTDDNLFQIFDARNDMPSKQLLYDLWQSDLEGPAIVSEFMKSFLSQVPNVQFRHADVNDGYTLGTTHHDLHMLAWKAPENLAFDVINLAIREKARSFLVTPSATEYILPTDRSFNPLHSYLSDMPDFMPNLIANALYDRNASPGCKQKYIYSNPLDAMKARSLKGIFALALAEHASSHGYKTTVTLFTPSFGVGYYNQPDFAIGGELPNH